MACQLVHGLHGLSADMACQLVRGLHGLSADMACQLVHGLSVCPFFVTFLELEFSLILRATFVARWNKPGGQPAGAAAVTLESCVLHRQPINWSRYSHGLQAARPVSGSRQE
jgi:hypothetical protein